MKLQINENIRRLRRERNMTQEQLAERLCISTAAVSKWETGSTYPDITLMIPLAQVLGVSLDELMDYNAAKIEAEIESIIAEYHRLSRTRNWSEAHELINRARKDYPNDFTIMHWYIQHTVGGAADNDPKVLIEHKDEIIPLCDCIIEGCPDERCRYEAKTTKAKILHAEGDTDGALKIIGQFPSWYQSSAQKTEQLFAKDTPEFRRQLRINMYELANFTANKMVKSLWYDPDTDLTSRTHHCFEVAALFYEMFERSGDAVFMMFAYSAYGELHNVLKNRRGKKEDTARALDKYLDAAKKMTEVIKTDADLRETFIKSWGTDDPYDLIKSLYE